MKLLIFTQSVDSEDPILGFFHEWLLEFAKHCESIEVVCLRQGTHALPEHVLIHELPKLRILRVFGVWRLSFQLKYDAVFVHMNPEYVLAAGWLWRSMGKKVALWYTHKSVTLRLRLATWLVHFIFTASKESFRLRSRKVHIVGHGINTALFESRVPSSELRLITVGRISPTKRLHDILPALDLLYARNRQFSLTVVGSPVLKQDVAYEAQLRESAAKRPYASQVRFAGAVAYRDLPAYFKESDVNLNLSTTGSLDKAVLDGFAAAVPAVSTNEAFKDVLAPQGLFLSELSPISLVEGIEKAAQADGAFFRTYVFTHHSLQKLIPAILQELA